MPTVQIQWKKIKNANKHSHDHSLSSSNNKTMITAFCPLRVKLFIYLFIYFIIIIIYLYIYIYIYIYIFFFVEVHILKGFKLFRPTTHASVSDTRDPCYSPMAHTHATLVNKDPVTYTYIYRASHKLGPKEKYKHTEKRKKERERVQ